MGSKGPLVTGKVCWRLMYPEIQIQPEIMPAHKTDRSILPLIFTFIGFKIFLTIEIVLKTLLSGINSQIENFQECKFIKSRVECLNTIWILCLSSKHPSLFTGSHEIRLKAALCEVNNPYFLTITYLQH